MEARAADVTYTTAVCRNGHRLTEANRYNRPDGGYRCRECLRDAGGLRIPEIKGPALTKEMFHRVVPSATCAICHDTGRVYGGYGGIPGVSSGMQRRLVACGGC